MKAAKVNFIAGFLKLLAPFIFNASVKIKPSKPSCFCKTFVTILKDNEGKFFVVLNLLCQMGDHSFVQVLRQKVFLFWINSTSLNAFFEKKKSNCGSEYANQTGNVLENAPVANAVF
jgi:hypothetical protein